MATAEKSKHFFMRILYIDIDSLRPDHLGYYGDHRNTSPAIEGGGADGLKTYVQRLKDTGRGAFAAKLEEKYLS